MVLSALSSADDVVRAMKLGATDYLAKPFDSSELVAALSRALGHPVPGNGVPVTPPGPAPGAASSGLQAEGVPELRAEDRQLISISPAMARARVLAERIAHTDVPVLVLGGSSSRKELIAPDSHLKIK